MQIENTTERGGMVQQTLHWSIAVAALLSLYWRTVHPVPKLPDTLNPSEKGMACATHHILYTLLIVIPIIGYRMGPWLLRSDRLGAPSMPVGNADMALATDLNTAGCQHLGENNDAPVRVYTL